MLLIRSELVVLPFASDMPELSDKPEVVVAELNEWFRFDKPRHYRLYVVSGRVGKRTPEDRYGSQNLTAVSNIVEFEILPADEKWASGYLISVAQYPDTLEITREA